MGNDLKNCNMNIFNLISGDIKKITWRQLSTEERCKKLLLYFNTINESFKKKHDKIYFKEDIINNIIELTNNKKILYKKQVDYDNVNNRIISLPCLSYDEDKDVHIYVKTIKKRRNFLPKKCLNKYIILYYMIEYYVFNN